MRKLIPLLFLIFWSCTAWADYAQAVAALKEKDYASAETLLQDAASKGDARAWNALGVMYLDGMGVAQDDVQALVYFGKAASGGNTNALKSLINIFGQGTATVPKNADRARAWAIKFAQANNLYAAFAYYQLTIENELSVVDEKGKFDRSRYAALAKRSVADRELDTQAFSLLSFAAERGFVPAVAEAQQILLTRSGEGVAERALSFDEEIQQRYATKISADVYAQLQQDAEKLRGLKNLGDSFVSVGLFNDVFPAAASAAYSVSGVNPSGCASSRVKVKRLQVTQRMQGKETLYIRARLLSDMMMLKGRWQELWTMDVCGKTVSVPVSFEADGWAGANFLVQAPQAQLVN